VKVDGVKALVSCRLSPWIMLWNRGDDRDLMHVMGLDRKAFNTLLTPFTALYNFDLLSLCVFVFAVVI